MVRQTELVFLTRAGAEVGVASTKAFTTQLAVHFLLALTLAKLRGHLPADEEERSIDALRHIPAALRGALALEPHLIGWAQLLLGEEPGGLVWLPQIELVIVCSSRVPATCSAFMMPRSIISCAMV